MGATNSGNEANVSELNQFDMQKYVKKGLTQQQVLRIREAFNSYHPVNGQIEVRKLKAITEESRSKDEIDRFTQGKSKLNFD